MTSKMPIADQFQDWVFEDVLPSIRKHGEYKLNHENLELLKSINRLANACTRVENACVRMENENKQLQTNMCIMESRVAVIPQH